jgi:phosphoserine phosphatase RsbU/P
VSPETGTELFDDAPCGLLFAGPDRRITAVNRTLARWLGYQPEALVGTVFTDLFSVGGRIHFETHFAPLLHITGELSALAIELVTADRSRLPVLISANVRSDADGRIEAIGIAAQDARDRHAYERELLAERRRAEHERERTALLAATLQRSLLPPSIVPPPGVEASAHYHAAASGDIGGDFYDLFPVSAGSWAFFLGDVSGKGAEAAALTSLTRYTLSTATAFSVDPVEMLQTLDTAFGHQQTRNFATVIVGTIQARDGGVDVHLASGGHPPALLLQADGQVRTIDTRGGQAVGLFAEPRFVARRLRLAAGETLLLYTDGLTEARAGAWPHRYDDDGALQRFAEAHAPCSAADIVAALQSLLGELGDGVQDDVALLALGAPR